MNWEELTGDQFARAVEACQGVCLLPLSCLERHAHHLPLGTDMLIGRELCRRAAALEPAIVFVNYVFTQILEAQHCVGTIAIEPELIVRLLENTCREIARNGLRKIVLVNAHGGNDYLLGYFTQIQLSSPRDYVVYFVEPHLPPEEEAAIRAQWQSPVDGHAGESETSQMLAMRPDLVEQAHLRGDGEGMPLGRLRALQEAGAQTGIWWYADHPTHYRGDGGPATAEKGERQLAARAQALANIVRLIKQDSETKRLQDEYFALARSPRV